MASDRLFGSHQINKKLLAAGAALIGGPIVAASLAQASGRVDINISNPFATNDGEGSGGIRITVAMPIQPVEAQVVYPAPPPAKVEPKPLISYPSEVTAAIPALNAEPYSFKSSFKVPGTEITVINSTTAEIRQDAVNAIYGYLENEVRQHPLSFNTPDGGVVTTAISIDRKGYMVIVDTEMLSPEWSGDPGSTAATLHYADYDVSFIKAGKGSLLFKAMTTGDAATTEFAAEAAQQLNGTPVVYDKNGVQINDKKTVAKWQEVDNNSIGNAISARQKGMSHKEYLAWMDIQGPFFTTLNPQARGEKRFIFPEDAYYKIPLVGPILK
ncbi:MAG TPA: hypothetical protein VLE91_04125 [Candidatus Saccharimonadales bacterium]|nr:hypothetical protein [Candidatus Saccharimonadales bacterium]